MCFCNLFMNLGYMCFDHVHHKFYTSTDVTFFKSDMYFAPTASSPIPSFEYLEKEIISRPAHVYTTRSKDAVSTSLPTDLESTVANHDPSHSAICLLILYFLLLRLTLLLLFTKIFLLHTKRVMILYSTSNFQLYFL